MVKSRYSMLGKQAEKVSDGDYCGIWNQQSVTFHRNFRGHIFTDTECEALCEGEILEVHNLKGRHGVLYAVSGKLAEIDMGAYKYVAFQVLDVITNNPSYRYQKQKKVKPSITDGEGMVDDIVDNILNNGIAFDIPQSDDYIVPDDSIQGDYKAPEPSIVDEVDDEYYDTDAYVEGEENGTLTDDLEEELEAAKQVENVPVFDDDEIEKLEE